MDKTINDYMREPTKNSMFLSAIEESELLGIVTCFKNKTSTDCDGVCMKMVKYVFPLIVKPFVHICNNSIHTGVFPD